ncbi:beta-glucosidase [Halolactibacillus miurensis]|uniref:Beta-glucosidase n=1 Tax=Halolactibacillus miurensis TaxID=306541 RepID=A0A1I6Q564_9BACI|nr:MULTISPECIES: glycoside hydrolase family 3 protein [Halolactibacillus]GEM03283.1 beta-glucosidase [Halolactibacillus miurensis]SFS47534.1 beta-glucosidase [Halolactibacillus miurensis]
MEKKKMSKKKFRTVWSTILSVLVIIVIGANIALNYYSDVITAYFDELDITSPEAVAVRDESKEVAEKIADEGIILLQNDDNALPLADGAKVNVFGWSFTNPIYGGTGSGGTDASTAITPLDGFKDAGIEVNQSLYDDYVATGIERPLVLMDGQDWSVPEPVASDFYTEDRINQAKEFSDTAVIFISRSGGEGADLPDVLDGPDTFDPDAGMFGAGQKFGNEDDLDPDKHYLELSNRERDMVEVVTANFDNIIVVVNSANTFELDWTREYEQVKSVINIAGPGQSGFGSLGKVLAGTINPSGRTVDLYATDLFDAPAAKNFGDFSYVVENSDGSFSQAYDQENVPLKYINYAEGIYVGYRYYETAAAEGAINYEQKVMYPFGHGLSYTTFEQEVVSGSLVWDDSEVTVDVEVTNTGEMAGKDVVQLYYSAPYTGNIEKSVVDLGAFVKTDVIEPGASQVVTLSFNVDDMASYDSNKVYSDNGAYVLESGEYDLMLMRNSHEKIADVSSKTLSETVFDETARETDQQVATNQFDEDVTGEGSIETYLSRENGFENIDEVNQNDVFEITTEEGDVVEVKGTLVDEAFISMVNDVRYDITEREHDEAPITGEDNGLTLEEFTGVDYDDERWEELLNQLSVEDMESLVLNGGYKTVELESVEKPGTVDYDGPAGISSFVSATGASGIPFPSQVMVASTWNLVLAEEMGQAIGAEAEVYGVTGWYAPGINLHRTGFAGRNFEYYSEDPLLSGKMAANAIKGYQDNGGVVYMKHFALNDQEKNRQLGVLTWSHEQAIREIYLEPFELAVKEGGAMGAMSAFNSIGTTWAGASNGLLNEVLRNEWGFKGTVITDMYIIDDTPYMSAQQAIRNGNDLLLTGVAPYGVPEFDATGIDTQWALRDASKNILYTTANSRAMDAGMSDETPQWVTISIYVNILIGLAIVLAFYFVFKNSKKRDVA